MTLSEHFLCTLGSACTDYVCLTFRLNTYSVLLHVLGGSLFLFDRKALRYFRKDGHRWRKKKDGKTVREAHEKLKVVYLCLWYLFPTLRCFKCNNTSEFSVLLHMGCGVQIELHSAFSASINSGISDVIGSSGCFKQI